MNRLVSKSIDRNVKEILMETSQDKVKLCWDFFEESLPKCGFGELGLCCNQCWQGPCRVDPFGNGAVAGSCGKTGLSMISENLSRQIINGLIPFLHNSKDQEVYLKYFEIGNWLNGGMCQDPEVILNNVFAYAGQVLSSSAVLNTRELKSISLDNNKKTVVISGQVDYDRIKSLLDHPEIQIYSMLNEFNYEGIEPLTNYGSQEAILAAGIPDLLIIGAGCGKPNLIPLAEKYGITYIYENDLHNLVIEEIEKSGHKNFTFSDTNFAGVDLEKLKGRKVALLAGCNNIRQTQDAVILEMAEELLNKNYVLVISGCAALALRKYFKENNNVMYLGSCLDTPGFIEVYNQLKQSSGQIITVFPELSQSKSLAQAVGLAASGIQTYVLSEAPIGGVKEFADFLNKVNPNLKINAEGLDVKAVLKQIL